MDAAERRAQQAEADAQQARNEVIAASSSPSLGKGQRARRGAHRAPPSSHQQPAVSPPTSLSPHDLFPATLPPQTPPHTSPQTSASLLSDIFSADDARLAALFASHSCEVVAQDPFDSVEFVTSGGLLPPCLPSILGTPPPHWHLLTPDIYTHRSPHLFTPLIPPHCTVTPFHSHPSHPHRQHVSYLYLA